MTKKVMCFMLTLVFIISNISIDATADGNGISIIQNNDDSVVISGNAGGSVKLRKVTVIITCAGERVEDISSDGISVSDTIEFTDATLTRPNGTWEIEWMPSGSGEYDVTVIIDGKNTIATLYYTARIIKQRLELDIANGDEAKIMQVFSSESDLKTLAIDLKAINDIKNREKIGQQLYYIRMYTNSGKNVLNYIDVAADLVRFIDNPTDFTFESMVNQLNCIGINIPYLDIYQDTEDEVIKSNALSVFARNFTGDLNELNEKFLSAIVLSAVRNASTWGLLDNFLKLLNYDTYNNSKYKDQAAIEIVGNQYDSISILETDIGNIIASKQERGKSDSGGGGGGGTGGGTGIKIPFVQAQPQNGDDERSKEKLVFNDVAESHWAFEAINYLRWKEYIAGSDANMFYPDENINRAEMVKMLVNAFHVLGSKKHPFADVSSSDWYDESISAAYANGLVNGDGANFNPNTVITRQDMAVMIYRFAKYAGKTFQNSKMTFADKENISSYAEEAVAYMFGEAIISGVGENYFQPLNCATRAQAAKLIYEIVK